MALTNREWTGMEIKMETVAVSADIFTVKRRLRDYRREMDHKTTVNIEAGLRGRSGRVVVTAIVM